MSTCRVRLCGRPTSPPISLRSCIRRAPDKDNARTYPKLTLQVNTGIIIPEIHAEKNKNCIFLSPCSNNIRRQSAGRCFYVYARDVRTPNAPPIPLRCYIQRDTRQTDVPQYHRRLAIQHRNRNHYTGKIRRKNRKPRFFAVWVKSAPKPPPKRRKKRAIRRNFRRIAQNPQKKAPNPPEKFAFRRRFCYNEITFGNTKLEKKPWHTAKK